MGYALKFSRYVYLAFVLLKRNIKWLMILLFAGNEKMWNVLDFKMFLNARKAGLCLDERSINKQLILDGIREKKSTEIMQQFIQADDIILELGANIGYYVAIESGRLSDKGYIYAVEPGHENIRLLKRNVALNDIKNIETYNIALSDKRGTAKLYTGKACNLHSLINGSGDFDGKYVEVETDTVDSFLKDKKPVSFIRMDIEGYEAVIVEGMRDTLRSPFLKKLFIEIHPHRIEISKIQSLLRILKNNGFEIRYAVSRDKYMRSVLKETVVEKISISQLIEDERLVKQRIGFELFLERK